MEEPVFKRLKRIIFLYNHLGENTAKPDLWLVQLKELTRLIANNPNAFPPLWKRLLLFWRYRPITEQELKDLFEQIPKLFDLEAADPKKLSKGKADNWGELYAHLAASIGMNWDEIDNTMKLSRVKDMDEYWKRHPPTHMLKAAELGYEYKEKQSVKDFFDNIFANARMH